MHPVNSHSRRSSSSLTLWVGLGALALWLVAFSQLGGIYDGDEGLHLLAALLVRYGRNPFVDFFYWHEPLYLYLASAWMALFGESWRAIHLLSALLTAGCAVLVGLIAARHARMAADRAWIGTAAASLVALNVVVLKWGTMGHNYALCLLLSTAAFKTALSTPHERGTRASFFTGLFAGAATATSLLMVPLLPVILGWTIAHDQSGRWRQKSAGLLLGAVIPFIPLLLLAAEAPQATLIGLVTHHLLYRVRIAEIGIGRFDALFSSLTSVQAVVLMAATAFSVWRVLRDPEMDATQRRDLALCAWLVISLAVFVAVIHPPAQDRYFVVVVPFAAVLAAAGIDSLAFRWRHVAKGDVIAAVVIGVFAMGLVRFAYRESLWASSWRRVERFAAEVNRVTTAEQSFYTSFTFVYFAARHPPPVGFENGWASQINAPPEVFKTLHLSPDGTAADRVRQGQFDTVLVLRDDPRFESSVLDRAYTDTKRLDENFVLSWDPRHAP